MQLCQKCNFAWVHAFPYSERPGTDAAMFSEKVPQRISGLRAGMLTEFAADSKVNYISQFIGKELDAVLETARSPKILNPSVSKKFVYHAVTDNFIHCEIITDKVYAVNTRVRLRIKSVLTERIKKGGEIEASAEMMD